MGGKLCQEAARDGQQRAWRWNYGGQPTTENGHMEKILAHQMSAGDGVESGPALLATSLVCAGGKLTRDRQESCTALPPDTEREAEDEVPAKASACKARPRRPSPTRLLCPIIEVWRLSQNF